MFRIHVLRQAIRSSDSKLISEDDIAIQANQATDGSQFTLTYRPEPEFFFRGTHRTSSPSGRLMIERAPGPVFEREQATVGLDELSDTIAAWILRLDEDLRGRPLWRALQEQEAELNQLFEQFNDLPEVFFSREEASELEQRLSELEAKLASHIQVSTELESDRRAQLKVVHEDIAHLKEQVQILTKPGWARSLAAKSWQWMRDPQNRALLKDGATLAKNLLLPPGSPPTS